MVGDIIKIKAGMYIPVDGILVWGSGVLCNESAITGESVEIKKESHENCKLRKEERD
jgi:Ca2+ transporting ATPase